LTPLAGPSGVLIAPTTRDLLEDSDLIFEGAGTYELKGLAGTRQVFRLVVPD
jgi:class 3 adenylate cyclase